MPDNTERNANDFDLTELNEDSIEALCSQLSNKDQITLKTAFEQRHQSNLRVEEGTDLHNALSVVMRVSKIKYDPKISTSRGKEYTPDLLPTYIKYVYENFTASEMRQIGLNLIFNSNLDRNQILEWCLHLANHVPAKYLSEDEFVSGWKNVDTINKISIMEGSKMKDLKKVPKPSFEGLLSVEALKSNFEKENSDQADHEQRAWFRMKDNEIVCYFPVLFFSVLRSRMGISEINYINRLKRVNGILSIIHYSENQILTLPDDHIFYKNIFIEKRQAEMNDKIQDIMAKCIYLFVKSENIELGLICGSLVARNAAYMGLSHYAMYKVLYDSIPEGARDWIIPACRVPNRKGEHENFVQLLLTISKVKDDEFWPFIRAVDTTVFGQYSTRNCISTVLSLAVLCDSIIKSGDDSESAYAGYVEVYKDRLDQRHIAYLNKMISYFKSEIENASSTCPMPSKLKSKGSSVRKEGESSKTSKRVRSTSRSNRSRSRSRSSSKDKTSDSEDEDNFEELFSKSD